MCTLCVCVLYIDVHLLVSLSQLHALLILGFHTTLCEERSLKAFFKNILNSILFTISVIFAYVTFWNWLSSKSKQCRGKGNGRALLLQTCTRPYGCRRLRLPELLDSRPMKVVRLSALRTGRLYQGSWDLNRDLPACSALPHRTAPHCAAS